jgi:DNA primase
MSKPNGWRAVNRKNPCPICGKPDNCSATEDGGAVICGRVSDGSVKEFRNGWLHILRERERDEWQPTYQPPKPKLQSTEAPLAPLAHRNEVYTAWLDDLNLSGGHADELARRGLHDTTAAYQLYATVPSQAKADAITTSLAARFDLRGVPGFYRQAGKWWLNVGDWCAGYFVPCRSLSGRIEALQIRKDEGEPRYIWLSSAKKPEGVSSGAPMHFAAPHRLKSGSVIITEGALKAEVIAQFTTSGVIGLAGVSNFKDSFDAALKLLGVRRVQIAFDADWRDNPQVQRALKRLGQKLSAAGLIVSMLNWDLAKGKGLDDVLAREVA